MERERHEGNCKTYLHDVFSPALSWLNLIEKVVTSEACHLNRPINIKMLAHQK
jgi:hypothetical protein